MPGLDRVYYANSGSEANEKVFKMVRQIAHRHHGGRKTRSCSGSATTMHTLATSLPWAAAAQRAIWPLPPGS